MTLMRANGEHSESWRDAALWQRSWSADLPDEEAMRFLDLAAFAEQNLDPDDEERVAEWLVRDPAIAGDIAAARAFAAATADAETIPDALFARACELVADETGGSPAEIVPFPVSRRRSAVRLFGMAQWGSLAAAVVVAGWLGFTLGADTSRSFYSTAQSSEEGFLHELLDPSTGFMQDLTGAQT